MLAELAAEFFGTLILMLFGNGVVAMVVLFGHGIPGEVVNGGYTNINFAFGIGVTMGMLCGRERFPARISIPAVTLAVAAFRKFPWRKVIPVLPGADRGRLLRLGHRLLGLPPAVSPGGS